MHIVSPYAAEFTLILKGRMPLAGPPTPMTQAEVSQIVLDGLSSSFALSGMITACKIDVTTGVPGVGLVAEKGGKNGA